MPVWHSSVEWNILFQMSEEWLKSVCRFWYSGIVQIIEHVRQCFLYMDICTSDHLVSVPLSVWFFLECFLVKIVLIFFSPNIEVGYPLTPVIVCLYQTYHAHDFPQFYPGFALWMLCYPYQALPLDMGKATLPDGIGTGFPGGFNYASSPIRCDTFNLNAYRLEVFDVLCYFLFPFVIRKSIKQCRLDSFIPIYHQAHLVGKPSPVNEKVNLLAPLYAPMWVVLQILVEPSV